MPSLTITDINGIIGMLSAINLMKRSGNVSHDWIFWKISIPLGDGIDCQVAVGSINVSQLQFLTTIVAKPEYLGYRTHQNRCHHIPEIEQELADW